MDSSIPTISVVVFSYNFEKYLEKCLSSLVGQSLQPFEIIVCDDCSTDNSWQIITSYKQQYPELFKIFRHDENIGHIKNGVFGKEQVTGELISVIDGDDWWLPDKLEREVATLQQNPEAKAVYSGVILVDEQGEEVGRWYREAEKMPPSGDVLVQTFAKQFFQGTRSLFRNQLLYTQVLRETAFRNENEDIIHADWHWKINLAAQYNIVFSGKALVVYRQHNQGISRQKSDALYASARYVIAQNLPLLRGRTVKEVDFVLDGLNTLLMRLAAGAGKTIGAYYTHKHVFQPRILVNSIPKSGTNLVTQLLSMMPGLKETNIHLGNSTCSASDAPGQTIPVGVDMPRPVAMEGISQALAELQSGYFLSCHIPYSATLDAYIREQDLKMLMVVRDPRDIVVSHARYIAEMKGHPFYTHYNQYSKDEQIWASIYGVSQAGKTLLSIRDRVQSMLAWMEHPNVLVVRFEDLVGPQGGGDAGAQESTIKRVADFLDVALGAVHMTEITDNLFGKSKTFRKGQIAAWHHVLNPDQLKAVESELGPDLTRLGYAPGQKLSQSDSTRPGLYELNAVQAPERTSPVVGIREQRGENLIFLVSQPRAGSTLMQRVLGGHSDIHTLAEPWIMLHPLYALRQQGIQSEYDASLARTGLEDFIQALPEGRADYLDGIRVMAATWYDRALANSGKSRFLDKTPRYYHVIPELHEVFPEARIILLLRNPLSVLSSVLKSWVGKNWGRLQLHRDDLLRAPALLVEGMEALGQQAIVLRYEDFVRAPEARLKHLCSMLAVPHEPAILDYGTKPAPSGRMGDNIGIKQHARPMPASLDKWRATFTDPMYHLLAEVMLTLIGPDVINRMGYNFNTLREELAGITPVPAKISRADIAPMLAALHLSEEKIAQIVHLVAPYLDVEMQPA